MGKTLRHRHRDGLSGFHRRISKGTDKIARNRKQRYAERLDDAMQAITALPRSPMISQAGRR
jgi:hypothetical protein